MYFRVCPVDERAVHPDLAGTRKSHQLLLCAGVRRRAARRSPRGDEEAANVVPEVRDFSTAELTQDLQPPDSVSPQKSRHIGAKHDVVCDENRVSSYWASPQ